MRQMAADGVQRAVAYVTSTFSSYSGCRKYREDLYEATADLEGAPLIDKLRQGYNHPGFIEAMTERVRDAFAEIEASRRGDATLLFTAHSLPLSMARHTAYQAQLEDSCALVAERLSVPAWELVYQSNNASYGEPWLEPDIGDALATAAERGARDAIVAPIGFVCDHMEVVLDLDLEARTRAQELGLNMVRAATVGTHAAYVGMVRELIVERMSATPQRPALGTHGPNHDFCPADCCLSGRPGEPKPSLCGAPPAS
jgi:ferrochelatase